MRFSSVLVRITLSAALVLVPAACGTSDSSATGGKSSGDGPTGSDSYPLPDCSGQDGGTCTVSGFDPAVDGFGFENWAEPGGLGATELIALFGRNEVCARGGAADCVLYPAARQWVEQVNEAMAGGHCEGMAVLSQLIYDGGVALEDFDPAAGSTFELDRETPAVSRAIEYWWATQMVEPVQEAYRSFQQYEPSEIAAELASGLQSGAGYTLGIYSPDGGHAVTPIAVTDEGGLIAIHVYDNNYPGTVQRIMVDPEAEQWSYAMGTTNPEAETGGWEGGRGSIELTPMNARRAKPFPAPYGEGADDGKSTTVVVTSPDPSAGLHVLLTVDGQTYDARDRSIPLPDGVEVRSIAGDTGMLAGNWSSVTVDRAKVGAFTVSLAGGASGAAAVPVTMSVDGGSSPRTTVRYAWDQGSQGVHEPVGVGPDGDVEIDFTDMGDVDVNVSNGLNSANLPVSEDMIADGVRMQVGSLDAEGAATVAFEDGDGRSLGQYEIDDESDSGEVTDILAEFDPETGEFAETASEVEAEPVDAEGLAFLEDLEDAILADDGTDDDGSDDDGSDDGTDDGGVDGVDDGSVDGVDDGTGDVGSGEPDGDVDDGGADDPADE